MIGTNLNSSIIFCLSFGDIYLFLLVVANFTSSVSLSSLLCDFLTGFFDILVNLSAILLPVKSPVASAVYCIAVFDAVFNTSVVDFLVVSISF